MADDHDEIEQKLVSIESKIDQLGSAFHTALGDMKNTLSGEISQVNSGVVTIGNNVTTAVTREVSETKRVLSEGFTEQRNKLSAIPAMQAAVTQAITSSQSAITEIINGLRSYVETSSTETRDSLATLGTSMQTVKSDIVAHLEEMERALLRGDDEILTKAEEIIGKSDQIKIVVDEAKESTDSLFVAYSKMVGEISRLATEAAQKFAQDLLIANELRDAVENCEQIIDIFNDLKGTYENIASIAAKGLSWFVEEGPMRKTMGQIEAAKDVSFALSSLANVFRAFKQERRESRFDF